MPTDYDALLALAKAATPGPWVAEGFAVIAPCPCCGRVATMDFSSDAAFIAACSPDVVTALVELVRAAESESAFQSALAREDCKQDDIVDAHVVTLQQRLATLDAAARALVEWWREANCGADNWPEFAALRAALAAPPQESI